MSDHFHCCDEVDADEAYRRGLAEGMAAGIREPCIHGRSTPAEAASGEPSTEAGRELLRMFFEDEGFPIDPGAYIAAIEAEARSTPAEALPFTAEQLANEMAVEGYADPDSVEQWAAPVEAARRILARLSPPTDTGAER
jgi:hypothetical protein